MKNCDRGLENAANNLFILFCVQKTVSIFVNTRTKSHESVTVARGQI